MARPLRIEFDDATYHPCARGNRRQAIYRDEQDRARFVELLGKSAKRFEAAILCFVLMGNHFHLIAQTRRPNLWRWMQWLLVSCPVYFSQTHSLSGHLFQRRYKSFLVQGGDYLLELSRYVHLNRVRGVSLARGTPSERRKRLRAFNWSSYRGYAGLGQPFDFVEQRIARAQNHWAKESRIMKRLTLAFLLLISITPETSVGACPSLLCDLDANGHRITTLEGIGLTQSGVSQIGHEKKVYIAKRHDGAAGSGTEIDPFDAGDDLHAMWGRVREENPSYVEFANASDPYVTTAPLFPISNCVINGNGATLTVSIDFGENNTHKAIFSREDANTDYSRVVISNFIFDGNIGGQTASNPIISAIGFNGSYNLIAHNKFLGFGSRAGGGGGQREAFVVNIAPVNTIKAYGNRVTGNEFTSIVGTTGSATLIHLPGVNGDARDDLTKPTDLWHHGGRIDHNYFHDMNGSIQCIAIGAWSTGESIDNNYFAHIDGVCIYGDTGSTWSNVIRDNYGEDVKFGIYLVNAGSVFNRVAYFNKGLIIENNTFYPKAYADGQGQGIDIGQHNYRSLETKNPIIRNNKIYPYWGSGSTANVGILLQGISGGTVENNVVDSAIGPGNDFGNFGFDRSSNVLVRENRSRAKPVAGGKTAGLKIVGNRNLSGVRLDSSGDRSDLGIHAGSATLKASEATVLGDWVTPNTIITVTATSPSEGPNPSMVYVSDITSGKCFTIRSSFTPDYRTINWIAVDATQ